MCVLRYLLDTKAWMTQMISGSSLVMTPLVAGCPSLSLRPWARAPACGFQTHRVSSVTLVQAWLPEVTVTRRSTVTKL